MQPETQRTMTLVPATLYIVAALSLLLVSPTLAQPTGTKCPPAPGRTETCVCQAPGGIIDLTPLSNTNGTARLIALIVSDHASTEFNFFRFTDLIDPNDYSYSYNPCKPFTMSEDCINVHVSL